MAIPVVLGEWDDGSDETALVGCGLYGTAVALLTCANSPLRRWPSDFLKSQQCGSTIDEFEDAR